MPKALKIPIYADWAVYTDIMGMKRLQGIHQRSSFGDSDYSQPGIESHEHTTPTQFVDRPPASHRVDSDHS
jgi:hypothetical protein